MNDPGVKWGVYLGVASIALTLILYLFGPVVLFSWGTWLSILLSVVFIVLACKEQREILGGYASFGKMFTTSFTTIIISSVLGVLFQIVLFKVIDPGLVDVARDLQIETLEKWGGGMSDDQMEQAVARIEASDPIAPSSLAMSLGFMAVGGAIVSLIVGAIMQKKDPSMI